MTDRERIEQQLRTALANAPHPINTAVGAIDGAGVTVLALLHTPPNSRGFLDAAVDAAVTCVYRPADDLDLYVLHGQEMTVIPASRPSQRDELWYLAVDHHRYREIPLGVFYDQRSAEHHLAEWVRRHVREEWEKGKTGALAPDQFYLGSEPTVAQDQADIATFFNDNEDWFYDLHSVPLNPPRPERERPGTDEIAPQTAS